MVLRKLLVAAALSLLSACATSGSIDIACPGFDDPDPDVAYRQKLPPTRLEQQIHGKAPAAYLTAESDNPLHRTFDTAFRNAFARQGVVKTPPVVMLLSGGGQWGAFGAGFMRALQDPESGHGLPQIDAVTGVSTGALQALFVAVNRTEAYDVMLDAYSPLAESEIVDRHPQWQAVIRGSVAGLKPLRSRIERRLCENDRNCILDELRKLEIPVLLGFIEATSGDFYYVDAVELAKIGDRAKAVRCLTGAALASAAMPVFFQQVRINGRTYYDGGVRQSVFEGRIAEAVARAGLAAPGRGRATAPDAHLYVIRNGPTTVRAEVDPDTEADALTAALRAEAIVVNQLEVGSIAALRLEHPRGPISLVTADRWNAPTRQGRVGGACTKPSNVMFDPAFMACLRRFGAAKAALNPPWISLDPIDADIVRRSRAEAGSDR